MVVRFELRIGSGKSAAELFDLARSVDAHVASMSTSRERAVGGITSGLLALGDEVTWRGVHFGVPLTMTSRITRMSTPTSLGNEKARGPIRPFRHELSFVDEQVRGPFRRFRHEHTFLDRDGGCLMIDRVEFEAPLGILGVAVERLVLARHLRRIIEERNVELAGPATPPLPHGSHA